MFTEDTRDRLADWCLIQLGSTGGSLSFTNPVRTNAWTELEQILRKPFLGRSEVPHRLLKVRPIVDIFFNFGDPQKTTNYLFFLLLLIIRSHKKITEKLMSIYIL